MTYIENIFLLVATPLVACLFCLRGRPRAVVAWLLVGMIACLFSAYVSAFVSVWAGLDAVHAAVEVAPMAEEAIKLLPLLLYLVVLEPDTDDIDLAFVVLAVGFATMESAFYLGDSGTSSPITLLMRGLGTSMMHVVCGVVVGYGLVHAWKHPWLRAVGTFGLLCLAMAYHGIFNLLVAADGVARIAAVILPLVTLVLVYAVRRRREKLASR